MTIREIETAQDNAWEDWRRIYYDSFPENERMTDDYLVGVLERKATGDKPDTHILVMTPDEELEQVVGMAYYDFERESKAGYLWYLATIQSQRGQGYGAVFYSDLLRRMQADGATLLLFEVEIPELARQESPEQGELAERRINWYRRQGALVLGGIQYFQGVDAPIAPVEMHIMAHPFAPMDADQVFAVASKLFEDDIRQIGPLSLT